MPRNAVVQLLQLIHRVKIRRTHRQIHPHRRLLADMLRPLPNACRAVGQVALWTKCGLDDVGGLSRIGLMVDRNEIPFFRYRRQNTLVFENMLSFLCGVHAHAKLSR